MEDTKPEWKDIKETGTTTYSQEIIGSIRDYGNDTIGTIEKYITEITEVKIPSNNFTYSRSKYHIKVDMVREISLQTLPHNEQKVISNTFTPKTNKIHITFEDDILEEIDNIDQLNKAKETCDFMAMAIENVILGK